MNDNDIKTMISVLRMNGVIAVPTESTYGLSSLLYPSAVKKILTLKKRDAKKGFIVLSSRIDHLSKLIDITCLSEIQIRQLKYRYCFPITWIVPVKKEFRWLTGKFNTIAVRLTTHPLLFKLIEELGENIVSTSANVSNMPPAQSSHGVQYYFGDSIDYIYLQNNFIAKKPSRLVNLLTGEVIRD